MSHKSVIAGEVIACLLGGQALARTPPTVKGTCDAWCQLFVAESRLDEMLQRFTPNHPDVIAARHTLEELLKRRAVELAGLQGRKEMNECQRNKDDPKRRQYHAFADRLQRVKWSDHDHPCFRPYILKPSAP